METGSEPTTQSEKDDLEAIEALKQSTALELKVSLSLLCLCVCVCVCVCEQFNAFKVLRTHLCILLKQPTWPSKFINLHYKCSKHVVSW